MFTIRKCVKKHQPGKGPKYPDRDHHHNHRAGGLHRPLYQAVGRGREENGFVADEDHRDDFVVTEKRQ